MHSNRLGRTLALGVIAVAVFNTLAALSMPVRDRRLSPATMIVLAAVLLAHAALYWWGDEIRNRAGMAGYLAAQAVAVFVVGLCGALFPVGVALYVALTAEAVIIAGQRWGTVPITLGAIGLFGASAIAASDLYRGANAGLLLAVTGVVAHAIAALIQRRSMPVAVAPDAASVTVASEPLKTIDAESKRELGSLTAREHEVLLALATGARTSDIAAQLGITERTVKAHLAAIYQKLGVESRTAALAMAMQRGLVQARVPNERH
jgi:DNA-binding CsgD family transcriptional regulator